MRYLRTYERFYEDIREPEVLKLYEYLKEVVKGVKCEFPTNTFYKDIYLEDNNSDLRGWKTYSIILDTYYHFIFQFDYKEDGMWIKYTCSDNIKNNLKRLEKFFDAIAKEKNEWGWCFDRKEFMNSDIDMYIKASNYNL